MTQKPQGRRGANAAGAMLPNRDAWNAIAHMQARAFRQALRYNAELLDFFRHRLEHDIATTERLSRCRDLPEVAGVATEFCRKATEDYAGEATTLMRLGAEMAQPPAAAASEPPKTS